MNAAVKVEPEQIRTANRIVSWLSARGIRKVFGVPGGAIAPVYDALLDGNIELVLCQTEMMAAYMASGYARVTGLPGVIAVTSGPGVLNTVSASAAAMLDEVPLLVIAGDVRSDWAGRGAVQDGSERGLDVVSVFSSVARFRATIDDPSSAECVLGHAWERVMTHPRGSALVRLPVDVSSSVVRPAPARWAAVPTPEWPSAETVEHIVGLLSSAKRPLVLAGVGAKSAGISDLILKLVHRMKLPIVTDVEGKGLVPEGDARCLGILGIGGSPMAAAYADSDVDLLVTIGARLDEMSTRAFTLAPNACLVQIDHDPMRMHRLRRADVPVAADLRATLEMMLVAAPPLPLQEAVRREAMLLQVRRQHPASEPDLESRTGVLVDPAAGVRALQQAVGPRAVFVSDIGNHLVFAARHLVAEHPGSFVVSHGLGSMGSGIGTAMGMAMAHAGARPVVSICGDGGLLMVGNELATCARYGIPVLVVVFDNRQLAMVEQGMRALYGRSQCASVPDVDILAYARALGVEAHTVRHLSELPALVRRVSGRPAVLTVPVDPAATSFNPRLAGFQSGHR